MACNGKIISLKSRELSNNFLFISLVNRGHKGSIKKIYLTRVAIRIITGGEEGNFYYILKFRKDQ